MDESSESFMCKLSLQAWAVQERRRTGVRGGTRKVRYRAGVEGPAQRRVRMRLDVTEGVMASGREYRGVEDKATGDVAGGRKCVHAEGGAASEFVVRTASGSL